MLVQEQLWYSNYGTNGKQLKWTKNYLAEGRGWQQEVYSMLSAMAMKGAGLPPRFLCTKFT